MRLHCFFPMVLFYIEMGSITLASRVDRRRNESCNCYDVTDYEMDYECRCTSRNLTTIPRDLGHNLTKLTVSDAKIVFIKKSSLDPYRRTLRDVSLSNLPYLREIEDGTFGNIPNLRTIYISSVPNLQFAYGLLQHITSIKFYTLRIVETGLLQVPEFSFLPSDNVVHLLELDRNKLKKLTSNSINVRAEQVTLNHNEISVVENYAFNGSEIGKLNLRGNRRLKTLEVDAFKGTRSLIELDLSETSIEELPAKGLDGIEILRIENTPSMKVIPSIYDLENLKVARLTHSFHCCAFKYPKRHNPSRYAEISGELKRYCEQHKDLDTGQFVPKAAKVRTRRLTSREISGWDSTDSQQFANTYHGGELKTWGKEGHVLNRNESVFLKPQRGQTIDHEAARPVEIDDDFGTFHAKSADVSRSSQRVNAFCGNLSIRIPLVKCYPEPNALNPCEDIMGYSWLRISVWFVVILTVTGNLAVIIVVIFSGGDISVTRFLICNLAIADLSMGLYLALIAFMDLHSVGSYFNYAYDWQYGLGCKLAGFLTVFASHLSVFTLTVVTIERWFAITYAIYLTKRIHIGTAAKTMIFGWIYSIVVAALPLMGVSNYSSTSICLPMEVNRPIDKAYLYFMILVNGVAFALIVYCYARIYFSLGYETRRSSSKGELTIAKKMALLIFTDFATFAPIAFFSLTALAGYPLIGVTRSKILLVFFYPLNSCANPYLYVIMTAQYRTDFVQLLAKCGYDKHLQRRNTASSNHQMQEVINCKGPYPLLPADECKHLDSSNNFHNDVYV
ncbi:lutropin-choriogonadotropic hormone receptor [Coccinella septempunctata]|uniref:lutropin-choriogonadotropic hormone receptor n=1 Tax=Coccinella septempunctata TaxID=41139 RepID=UPI001D06C0D8|nr:lutropin-choriogonadotropic hormone receptor [Coccinella septempunctata]